MNDNDEVVPRNDEGIARLLSERPRGWEFMLYAGALVIGVEKLEAQYDDYSLGYAPRSGVVIPEEEFTHYIQSQLSELEVIVSALNSLFSDEMMAAALGPPGTAGDANRIIHAANRVVRLYDDLLHWAERIRSMAMPDIYRQAADALVRFSEQPVNELRDFAFRFAARVNTLPAAMSNGEQVELAERVIFSIPDEYVEEFNRSLGRLR